MILSRVADALYWMGRYLERAENTARLLLVTEELSTELAGLDEELARGEWEALAQIFPGPERGEDDRPARHPTALAAVALPALYLSGLHPQSVICSLRRARENARTVREALTVEVFLNLNETYRELEGHTSRRVMDTPTLRDAISATQRGLMSTVGAIDHTLSRDPGWLFLRLGESMERLYRGASVLRAKLPALTAAAPPTALPLVQTRWRGLLRGLSSLENYRQAFGANLEPLEVLHFLLFHPDAPRSLSFGAAAVKEHLDRLSNGPAPSAPARIMGRLAAEFLYESDDVARAGGYLDFLDHVLAEVGRAHDAVSAQYFGV